MPPPFDVPTAIGENARARLTKVGLIELFESNRNDFIACQGMLYAWLSKPENSVVLNDPREAFNAYCYLLTAYLFAAPTMLNKESSDEFGKIANFFAKAITSHLTPRIPVQDWYGPNGGDEYSLAWNLERDFIGFLAIEAFSVGIHTWQEPQLKAANDRIMELRRGVRTLVRVLSSPPSPFGAAVRR